MRCPRCRDEYEPEVATCATCGIPLLAAGEHAPPRADVRLGRFHPAVADHLVKLLTHRGIAHRRIDRDDDVELLIDEAWRDDMRAELAMTWARIVHGLPEEQTLTVLGLGGASPGWFDAPRGGWVDRSDRLVVDRGEDDREPVRLAGPTMAILGAVLLLLGWYTGASDLVIVTGVGLTIVGLLLPR
jgi:hypothetical protein